MRPSRDDSGLMIALVCAQRGTCVRRKVGCLLVDKDYRHLSSGYNGPQSGAVHCIDVPCAGAGAPSGTGLDACEAIHAEANALLYCPDVRMIDTCYVTASPCVSCVKLLLGTNCRRIVFIEPYPHPEAKVMWESAGREWCWRVPTLAASMMTCFRAWSAA